MVQTEYIPCQWKVGQIIMIVKPRKNPNDITSYRPISPLQILSKILEKILLKLEGVIPLCGKIIYLLYIYNIYFRQRNNTIYVLTSI